MYYNIDYAGGMEDRRSPSSFIIILSHGPVKWNSEKDSVMAQSSINNEIYCALAYYYKQMIVIKNSINKIHNTEKTSTMLHSHPKVG